MSAGYEGLGDYILVAGVDQETLVRTVDERSPGMGSRALDAIANGTLRIRADTVNVSP